MVDPCLHVHRSLNLLFWGFHPERSRITPLMITKTGLPLFIPLPGNGTLIGSCTHERVLAVRSHPVKRGHL